MKLILSINPFFLFLISLRHFVYAMDCPPTVYVELGKDGIINCQILNSSDVYWYKGNSTKTSPIVRLKNGQKNFLQESNRYDIDEEGSLIIRNIEEQHYGVYSVVTFYANDEHDTDQIKVEIAVKPQTMCPIIAGCNDCNHCVLTESETGNISCSIGGTRPHVQLSIVTDSENWINVIRNVSEQTYDPVTDTWSTTATIQYSEWYDCRSQHLRCVTENKQPFELFDSVARVELGFCKATTQVSGYQTPLVVETKRIYVIGIVILIGVIFIVIVLVLAAVLCRKSGICRHRKRTKRDINTPEETHLLQKIKIQAAVQLLMDHVKGAYENLLKFTSTLDGDYFSVDDVFKGINFSLTEGDNDKNTVSSSKLMEILFQKRCSIVVIEDGEFLRKAFVQYVCGNLCQENQEQEMILFVNLKGLDGNISIADAINKELNLDGTLSSDVIEHILETRKCLLLFDEVHELKESQKDQGRDSKNMHPGGVTVNDVLTGSHLFRGYQKARYMFISKNKINVKSSFTELHIYVRIEPFSPKSLKPYVKSILKYYQQNRAGNSSESTENIQGVDNASGNLQAASAKKNFEQDATCVTNLILDEENIIKQADMYPSLLILFIHMLILDITKRKVENLEIHIQRRSYLTRLVIECLQFQYSPIEAKRRSFEPLMSKLGQASFEKSLEDTSFTEICYLIPKNTRAQFEAKTSKADFSTAFAMGLLKPVMNDGCSKDTANNDEYPSSNSMVEFRHKYIQEYLAAQAIASNQTAYQKYLESPTLSEDGKLKRLLTFMYGLEEEKQRELIGKLAREKKWNILIDFLFECGNNDDFNMSALSPLNAEDSVNISDMDSPYHSMAVDRFCQDLVKYNVSLKALTFQKACRFEYFSKMKIPKVEVLVFSEIDFQEKTNFIPFVKAACHMNATEEIQFVKCECPEQFSIEEMQCIAQEDCDQPKLPQIFRTDDSVVYAIKNFLRTRKFQLDTTKWKQLNFQSGCWETI